MTQPQPNIVVKNSDIRKYFNNEEWRELSAYEKEQTRNVLRNHLVMISCGIKAPLPFFVTNFEARQEIANEAKQASGKRHPAKAKMTVDESPKGRGRPLKKKRHPRPPASTTKSTAKSTAKSIPKSIPKKTPPVTVSTRQQPPRQSKLMGPLFRTLREDLYD